jgi:hypothetical protein
MLVVVTMHHNMQLVCGDQVRVGLARGLGIAGRSGWSGPMGWPGCGLWVQPGLLGSRGLRASGLGLWAAATGRDPWVGHRPRLGLGLLRVRIDD